LQVKRWWHAKDESLVCILNDVYAKIVEKTNVTFDEVLGFCQRIQVAMLLSFNKFFASSWMVRTKC
jgi:hypothetical protein